MIKEILFHVSVHGAFLSWSEWSTCQVSCGPGNRTRTRECKPPQHGGHPCQGKSSETSLCDNKPCPGRLEHCLLGLILYLLNYMNQTFYVTISFCVFLALGQWAEWSEWGLCSVTCNGGLRVRTRNCTDENGELTTECTGNANERTPCHTYRCQPGIINVMIIKVV